MRSAALIREWRSSEDLQYELFFAAFFLRNLTRKTSLISDVIFSFQGPEKVKKFNIEASPQNIVSW